MEISLRPRWRVPEHASLVWRYWDCEYVFHHALSNDTHRLSEIPGHMVVHLAMMGEQSVQGLADQFGLDDIEVEEILARLADLDFVTCRS